jgi:chromosome segregation ATPase
MPRIPSTLFALALAATVTAPALAQQITTSHGVRTLTRTDGYQSEQQFRQAARLAEDVVLEILQDIDVAEKARGSATAAAAGISTSVAKTNSDLVAAKAAFDQKEQQYRTDLASFQQRQAKLEEDIQTQRQQASALEALPSAQREWAEVSRLNDWAQQLSSTRTQLDADRNRLLADHDSIEAERAKLAQQRSDAEASLNGQRETTLGQYGQAQGQRARDYANLRTAITYLRSVRERQAALSTMGLPPSEAMERGTAKLAAYDKAGGR